MIIRLIPETAEEREKTKEVTIPNVKEFFLFGSNITEDGNFNEFHEWVGSYKYLMGTLTYYYEEINDEREESRKEARRRQFMPSVMPPSSPSLRVIEDPDEEGEDPDEEVE